MRIQIGRWQKRLKKLKNANYGKFTFFSSGKKNFFVDLLLRLNVIENAKAMLSAGVRDPFYKQKVKTDLSFQNFALSKSWKQCLYFFCRLKL